MNHTRHTRRRRRRFRWALLALALLLAAALWDSNRTLSVEQYTIPLANLPPEFDGLRIVQLTDLHGAEFGPDNRRLLQAVREAGPDLIVLTGDLLDCFRETPQDYAVALTAALAEIAPTYFVTGNHEWAFPDIRELKRELRDAGVTVLSNEYVSLSRDGDHILLAGIDDPNGFADQKTPEELARELLDAEPDAFWLLLAHRNNYFEKEYSFLGADLVICGHGHGGLIRLPFTDGLVSVERSLFPSYTAGFYEANGGKVFVSRGLGNSGRTFRLFNRPEMVVLTLHCQ